MNIAEQLLHQLVVVIGEGFEHGETRRFFLAEDFAFERHDLGRRVLFVDEGAFEREVDETADDLAGKGRNLPHQQPAARGWLQELERVVYGGVGLVEFIEEQNARNFLIFKLAHDELKLCNLLLVHFADYDRCIDCWQRRAHVVDEFDGTRAVEERIVVAHEIGGGDRKLDAHAVMARFLAGVADGGPRMDRALTRDRAGAGEDRLKQGRLAALKRAHQRNAPGTRNSCAVLCHIRLPMTEMRPSVGRTAIVSA